MAETRISEVVLKAKSDVSGFVQLRVESAKIRGEIQYLAQTAKQAGLASVNAGKNIREAFTSQTSSRIDGIAKSTDRLKKSFDDAAASAKKAKEQSLDALEPDILGDSGGGGGAKTSLLRTAGRELKALPAVQIPGVGVSTDAVGKILQLVGSLGPVGLAAAAGLGALTAVLAIMTIGMQDGVKATKALLEGQEEYFRLLLTGSKSQVQAAIDAKQQEKEIVEARLATNKQTLDDARKTYGALGAAAADISNQFGLRDVREQVQKDEDALKGLNVQLGQLNPLLNNSEIAARDVAKAEEELAAVRTKSFLQGIQTNVNTLRELKELSQTGTEKQVRDRIRATQNEIEVLQYAQQAALDKAHAEKQGSEANKEASDAAEEYGRQIDVLKEKQDRLTGGVLEQAKANDAATAALEEQKKIRTDSIAAVTKYNSDITNIDAQYHQKEIDLATKLADQQVEIAQKAVEDSEKLLAQLTNKLGDLQRDAQRDLDKDTRKANFDSLRDQIKFMQDEVAAEKKHAQDVERIRRQSREREFELGLDRDFAGLAAQRRTTANQISESNIQFNEDRQARLEAFRQKQADDAAQFAFERQERLIKFEQDVTDARLAYARERIQAQENQRRAYAEANAAYTRDLNLLRQKHLAELSQRNSEIQSELKMIAQGTAGKLALEAQYWEQSRKLIQGIFSNGGTTGAGSGGGSGAGGPKLSRAYGGSLLAGQTSRVNEPFSGGGESFSNSRGTIPLPGYGLFTPFSNGTVNAKGIGHATVYLSIDARGKTNEEVGEIVDQRLTNTLEKIFGDK